MAESNRLAEPRRADSALESHILMRRATWCGIVCALAVLITALNLVPPVGVSYRVVSQAVISETRLQQLQAKQRVSQTQQLASAAAGQADSAPLAGLISAVKVLDRTQADAAHGLESGASSLDKPLVLVEVESQWAARCSDAVYTRWLDRLTRSETKLDGSQMARAVRIARWQLAAAEHYASRHQFLNQRMASSTTNDGRTFQLANTPAAGADAPRTSLATFRPTDQAAAEADASGGDAASAPVAQLLDHQVTAARQKLAETELAWQRKIGQSSGEFRVSGGLKLLAMPSSIPLWMAASVLIVGLASGSTAGWLQHRLQSGGVYDPQSVARQLEKAGLPQLGKLALASEVADAEDWVGKASFRAGNASRRAARQLTRISECLLGFWCLLIAARLLLDPLWRGVLLDSPLAAFGRLLAGMP